jgi:hypothetical protein
MNEDQFKHRVARFLGWKLPASFRPDRDQCLRLALSFGGCAKPDHAGPGISPLLDEGHPAALPVRIDRRSARHSLCKHQAAINL